MTLLRLPARDVRLVRNHVVHGVYLRSSSSPVACRSGGVTVRRAINAQDVGLLERPSGNVLRELLVARELPWVRFRIRKLVAEDRHAADPECTTVAGTRELEARDEAELRARPEALTATVGSINERVGAGVAIRVCSEAFRRRSEDGDEERGGAVGVRGAREEDRRGGREDGVWCADGDRDRGVGQVAFGEMGDERRIRRGGDEGELGGQRG